MIDYFKGVYGINLLVRVHGSSLFKGSLVGFLSVLVFLAIKQQWNRKDEDLDHPYGVGVLVSSVSFVIIFRANYGYQRYWEACGALHQFMSKWMDATMHAAVFHLQSKHYDDCRPPNFFDQDKLNTLNLTRDRKRRQGTERTKRLTSVYDCEKEVSSHHQNQSSSQGALHHQSFNNGNNNHNNNNMNRGSMFDDESSQGSTNTRRRSSPTRRKSHSPLPNTGHWDVIPPTPDKASSDMIRRTNINSTNFPSAQYPNLDFGARPDGRTPPLFLQELAHLSSLACAVALSTLRNDIEFSESPLDMFVPGAAWPPSDPDRLPKHVRTEFQHRFHFITIARHWLGMDRLPHWRSKYNASRPLLIIGGVSNSEIEFLQKAKGPHAKAALALSWLKEFIIREHLEGSLGEVHSAIISRLVQFISDGTLFYHQARKIMYIPFPFPHAQLSAFFTVLMVVAVPFLMDQYTNHLWMGSIISFLTVTCLVGLHEVSRELENPFRNVPNEIPLCTLQAMYNETLVTMFSGYNPDSFWDAEMHHSALQAVAMGKVYKQPPNNSDGVEEAKKEMILEMPVLVSGAKVNEFGAENNHSPEKKSVTFSPKVESNSDVANTHEPINGVEEAKQDAVLEMPVQMLAKEPMLLDLNVGEFGAGNSSPEKKNRSVTFSSKVETNIDVAKELRDLLAKQALEIDELVRILDEEEEKEEENRGKLENTDNQRHNEQDSSLLPKEPDEGEENLENRGKPEDTDNQRENKQGPAFRTEEPSQDLLENTDNQRENEQE